ncbi:TolC family protein [bacterium]|nr:TolC family protein [bacterium]
MKTSIPPSGRRLFCCAVVAAALPCSALLTNTNDLPTYSVEEILHRERGAFISTPTAQAQQYFAAQLPESNVYISLRDCIVMGLEKNLGLTIERYAPNISKEDIRLAISVFDPQFYGMIQWSGQRTPRPYEKTFITGDSKLVIGNTHSENFQYNGRIFGKFITGLEYSIGMANDRSWTEGGEGLNAAYSTATDGSLVMPLLKGFGIGVNLAPVRIARNNQRIAEVTLESLMQDMVTQIIVAYWNLYAAREQLSASYYSLTLARELLSINEAKVSVGMAAPIDVTQAKARIASQEDALLVAANAVRNAEDILRGLINFEMDTLLRPKAYQPAAYHLIPLEKPQIVEYDPEETKYIATAIRDRQTLEIAYLNLENTKQTMKVARNNLLPQLNALGSLGWQGVGENFDNAYDDEYTARHPRWSAGLEVLVPLFYNAEVATYRQAKYRQRQAEFSIEQVKQQIAIEVRAALRAVQTNRKRIDASREATRYAREQLNAEQEKFNVGQATTYDVLLIQNDLASALSAEISALVEWRNAVAALELFTGTTLDKNGIVFDSYSAMPEEQKFIDDYIWR